MLEDLYNLYKKQNTETISNNADPVSSPKKGVPMATFMDKLNYQSQKMLGTVGRPVTTGIGIGMGTKALAGRFGRNPSTVATVAIATVASAAVELGLFFLTDTSAFRTVDSVDHLSEKTAGEIVNELVAAGVPLAEAKGAVAALDTKVA